MNFDTSQIKKQVNSNLRAEILFYELQQILKTKKNALVKFVGVSKRNQSKDVLDISTMLYQDKTGFTNEAIVLHISKNSIYHNLPELLFHPLSISNATMSNKEIVNEVKKNKEAENEALGFFMPLDNELFKLSSELLNRSLHVFNDNNTLFFKIIDELIAIDYELSNLQKQNLFLFLCDGEIYKENLSEIEKLLSLLLENPVKIKYKKHVINQSAYLGLGNAILGFDSGLCGAFESEIDDLEVTLFFDGTIDYTILTKKINLTKKIMEYFIISARKIDIVFFNNYQLGIKLNENYLGINTII